MVVTFIVSSNCSIFRNLPRVGELMKAAADKRVSVTPPFKPYLEEKSWFALFWLQPLREFWRRELGEKYFLKLQEVIPYTWFLDPTPLPQHAVIPRLEIHDWHEAARLSQKDRDLLLKVSGFSPLAWGSRGISLGSDLAQAEWEKRIDNALTTFESAPTILQKFHKGKLFEQRYWDADSGELKIMKGRVRLCPVLLCRTRQSENARRIGDNRSRRQKISARHARRDSRAHESAKLRRWQHRFFVRSDWSR